MPDDANLFPIELKEHIVSRRCHICGCRTESLDYSICKDCRDSVLFAKELKEHLEEMCKRSSILDL